MGANDEVVCGSAGGRAALGVNQELCHDGNVQWRQRFDEWLRMV